MSLESLGNKPVAMLVSSCGGRTDGCLSGIAGCILFYIYMYIYIFEIEKPYNLDIEVLYEVCGDVNWFFDCDSDSVWQYRASSILI